jgi:thioredoxin-like negative regulator of GroEL
MAVRGVLVACTLAAVASASPAGDPGWESNLPSALARAKQAGKPVLVDVAAEWCGPCQKLAAAFRDPQVAAALQRGFVAVKIDADADAATARKYKVSGLPTLLVLSADGKELARTSGAMSAADLRAWLAKVGARPSPKPPADDLGRQLDAIFDELSARLK